VNTDRIDDAGGKARLIDVLLSLRRTMELELRVEAPATVTAYNPTTQRATVTMGFVPVAIVEGEEVPGAPIVIPEVPVEWVGGSLGYVTTQLVPGDTGKVSFSDRALSTWLVAGGAVDPINGRTHALGDATFRPGLRHAANVITPPTSIASTVIEGPLVDLGRAATNFAVLGTALASAASTLSTVLAAVPAASDPATVVTLANANKAAILGLLAAIGANLSAKVRVQ
jgi:hypothetical protein